MKRLLLFAAVLTLWGNLSVCYADNPEEEIPVPTVKVLKPTEKAHDGKPGSTYAEVSLLNTHEGYCYYCPSENTWHIYTCGDKVVYQGGEMDKPSDWYWLKQSSTGRYFKGGPERNFVSDSGGAIYGEIERTVNVSESPRFSLLPKKNAPVASNIQFHHGVYKKEDAVLVLNVTVSYKDSEGKNRKITVECDTTLAAGSEIESVTVSKNGEDALAVRSIRCGTSPKYDIQDDFLHNKDFSKTIYAKEIGVSQGAAVQLKITYDALDADCQSGSHNLEYKIAIDNHSDIKEMLTSSWIKGIAGVIVLLLAFFCVRFYKKNRNGNKREAAPMQAPDTKLTIEKQRKEIKHLLGEKQECEKEIENLNGQLQSVQANLNGAKNRIANLQRDITAKDGELEKYKERLSKVQGDCELLKKDKEKLKAALQNIDAEYKRHETELTESYSRQIEDLSKAVDSQRDKFTKELTEKDTVHERQVEQMCDRHQKEIDSIRQENRHEVETLTADFNAKDKIYADDFQRRMEGGKKLLEDIYDDVNRLSSSALSTSAYGRWIEQMLDGESPDSLPLFYETFSANEPPFEAYRHIRSLIESSVSDVNSWINTLARLASYVSLEAIASDMRKDGADIPLLTRAFELMMIFMALYGYQCIVPKLFTGTVGECSDEFVRDNTDLFINKISGAVFREVKSGVVCDFSSVACVRLVDSSDGNRLIKGKVNSL